MNTFFVPLKTSKVSTSTKVNIILFDLSVFQFVSNGDDDDVVVDNIERKLNTHMCRRRCIDIRQYIVYIYSIFQQKRISGKLY